MPASHLVVRDSDAPPLSGDTPRGRFYRLTPDGPLVYPSITNIKGVKNSEALNGWRVKVTATKALDWLVWFGRTFRTDQAKAVAALDRLMDSPYGTKDWLRTVKREHRRVSDERAARGTRVHIAVEHLLTGRDVPDGVDPEPVAAFQTFARDFEIVPVEVECTVVNHTHRYAGTGDLLGRVGGPDGPLAFIDWKSRNSIFEDTALQLAALTHAEFILRADGQQVPFERPTIGIGVALGDDGTYYAHQMDVSEESFRQFLGARALFDFDGALAKGPRVRSAAELVNETRRQGSDLVTEGRTAA